MISNKVILQGRRNINCIGIILYIIIYNIQYIIYTSLQQFRFIIGDAETDIGVETAESKVTSFDLLWPWIVISYESCRNDRFELLMISFDLSSMTFEGFDDLCSVSSSNENSVTELDGSFWISSLFSLPMVHKVLNHVFPSFIINGLSHDPWVMDNFRIGVYNTLI